MTYVYIDGELDGLFKEIFTEIFRKNCAHFSITLYMCHTMTLTLCLKFGTMIATNKMKHYHSKSDVCLFQRWPIICSIACHSNDFAIGRNFTFNDTFDQCIFIGGRRTSQDTQTRPNFVQKFLLYIAVCVANARIELTPVQN